MFGRLILNILFYILLISSVPLIVINYNCDNYIFAIIIFILIIKTIHIHEQYNENCCKQENECEHE